MEYMAYGKPIVAFDLKETRFSAGEAAIYVRPNEEAEFAATVAKLMGEPELRNKMGAYGRRRVEEELQWSKVGRNLLAAYDTLLADKRPAHAKELVAPKIGRGQL
jgi:glycosyltransferase involved in cell wall biosynthesis